MPERPIILFPNAEKADREKRIIPPTKVNMPAFSRQYSRLAPVFSELKNAFDQKAVILQNTPTGLEPEMALVIETVGSVDNFFTAVKHVEGLEWMFDISSDAILPDEDFYKMDAEGQPSEKSLSGKLYCIMSNKTAMTQLISLWQRHNNGEEAVFQRGFAGVRDVFVHVKDIRLWSAQDRVAETNAIEYWTEQLEFDGDTPIPFEIELFFRQDVAKRADAMSTINVAISELNGNIVREAIIEDIRYHGLLVEMPRNSIQMLVNDYTEVDLVKVDDIMFFRPTCQSAFVGADDPLPYETTETIFPAINGEPLIAVLDGMPLQNHPELAGRLIIDDPDGYEENYESKFRVHGTAMASLVIHGDLERNVPALTQPIYFRPILKPIIDFNGRSIEIVPQNELLIDLIHRAIVRIMDGEGEDTPRAPSVRVVNLSIGDPAREFANSLSPLARLLDWLSYKYKILFIISAGNHNDDFFIPGSFQDLKNESISQRTIRVFSEIEKNIRHFKVLSPAESINSVCVGAIYADACNVSENDRLLFAVENDMPSPISSFGFGYNSQITPTIFYYGGRKFLIDDFRNHKCRWAITSRAPGCKVASPNTDDMGIAYSFGTSDAAAQITHEAGRCFEILSDIFADERGENVPSEHSATLLKAMLVHGATWDNIGEKLSRVVTVSEKQLSGWLGNGIPDISKVEECAKNRVTLIGIGSLKVEEAHVFHLPLPFDFSQRVKRKLTITLAYLAPVDHAKQKYRSTQLYFDIDDNCKRLLPSRQNTDWQRVRKGTIQHEIFMGEDAQVWGEQDIIIRVNCKTDSTKNKDLIPYAVFVTFEVAEGLDIDVYSTVVESIRQQQPVAIHN